MEQITSTQNPKIKNLVKLQKASERRDNKLFLVEGLKEVKMASDALFEIESLFWCPELGVSAKLIPGLTDTKRCYEITRDIFSKIAYREGSDGIVAVFKMPETSLSSVQLSDNPFVIIVESVEKPGNLGAILRTADAVNADAVIVCDPRTDVFNPNVIRSSVGCVFSKQIVTCTNDEAFKWLRVNKIKTYAAAIRNDSLNYTDSDFILPSAIIMGTEANGLSEFWLDNADVKIIIPMLGKNDSLNVSVSTAVLAYEVVRQRHSAYD